MAIDARDVRKRFGGVQALDGVSLQVPAGMVYGLLGPNGAGKTTLIRALVGLVRPEGGELHVLGARMPRREVLASIGYMTQAPALYADLSVEENARFFARVMGGGEVEPALRFVDLWDRRRSITGTLSGGMRTRLSLACALVHRPSLLLLDEPTVGVDPQLRARLWDGLREMAATGTTILVSSHVMDEAERADRLGLIRDGRLLAEGTVSELLALAGTDRLEDAFLTLSADR
ncbi:MAG: ABC transporter ATP-binding protein [Candidatus Limnocylindria bacterium]